MSIEVINVTKQYGSQKVLNQVSFKVNKGEIVGFLGPNGAGKSTLIKILATYVSPTKGTAKVNGIDVQNNRFNAQKNIGYLPEHNPLYLEMYVREYLYFNATIYGIKKERIAEVIALTGLAPEAHKKINQLSKGYRQRVGLAAALLHSPEVLLLDEPTTGLDPNQLVEIRKLIKSIGSSSANDGFGKTILLSSHIMQEVEAMCDRVIIINKGSIVADRSLDSINKGSNQVIEVAFNSSIKIELFEQIPNISTITNTHGFVYELVFSGQEDNRPTVFDFAQNNHLKIIQLNEKKTNLEQLFRTLTAS